MERNTIMFNAADRGELRTTEEILRAVYDALDEKGYNAIDYVVATHPDADHINGMPEVLEAFGVGTTVTISSGKLLTIVGVSNPS